MKIDFECPICSSQNFAILYPDTLGEQAPQFNYNFGLAHTLTYRVVRCLDCTHVYCSPRPQDLYLGYTDVIDNDYLDNREQRIATGEKVFGTIRRYMKKGRLLDVGCATGDFLTVARKWFQAEGLELSEWSARIASDKGFTIHRKKLGEMDSSLKYDVITMWGVIEHFEFPEKELAHIHRLLNPGGIVCLWTGDIDSITAKILRRKWWYFQGQHIQMFTRQSLEKLFYGKGFSQESITWYPYIMTLRSVSKSLCRYPVMGAIATRILNNKTIGDRKVVIKLPGEMFAIFRKGRA